MDELGVKSVIIGVSILVTLTIVTVIILEFSQISNIYKATGETNITFEENLDEFNKFKDSGNEFNGLDVKNTVQKYKKNSMVNVCVGLVDPVCDDEINIPRENFEDKYTAEFTEENEIYKITFIEK